MPQPTWQDRLLTGILVLVLLTVGGVSLRRAARGQFDFEHFYLDARYVWDHGTLNPDLDPHPERGRRLPFYLPVVPLALAPLTALGRLPAAVLWALAQVATLGYCLHVLRRWGHRRRTRAPNAATFALALLLAAWPLVEATKFNQLTYFILALVLAGCGALERGRPGRAGAILGAAAVLKLLPAIFLPWLLLKRRWTAAGAFVAAGAVLTVLPPLLVFGPQRTAEYHRQWWTHNVQGAAARGMVDSDLREHFVDHRNQSIGQVIARLAWPQHPYPAPLQPLQLRQQTCAWLAYGLSGVLLAALAWNTRHPWRRLSVERQQTESAVYALGMLVFSPLLRMYYLVWAFPALVLAVRLAADDESRRARRLGRIALAIWVAGMVAWLWPTPRLLGAHLVMLILLGGLLLWASSAPRGNPSDDHLTRGAST